MPSTRRPLRIRTQGGFRLAFLAALLGGCSAPPQAPKTDAGQQAPASVRELTLLYTSDEHGWLESRQHERARRGGAVQLLQQLLANEDHCAGALPGMPQPDCSQSRTVLLSGGDNYTGPAISSYFKGATMARGMRRLGYAASALGNHDFDFGLDQLTRNKQLSGMAYLASNVTRTDGGPLPSQPYVMVRRQGLTVGVIGLTTVTTPTTSSAKHFESFRFGDPSRALARVVPQVWSEGADAVVVIAHECHDVIAPIIEQNPQWSLSFVGTGHCHRTSVELINGTPVMGPSWRLEHYARVELAIDRRKPPRERAQVSNYELMEVTSLARLLKAPAKLDLEEKVATWREQVERVLGKVIGYSAVGMSRKSKALGHWIVGAWKKALSVDVAISTQGAIRQAIPPGPISMATVASIMPFENELITCEVLGSELAKMLRDPEAIVVGLQRTALGTYQHLDGSPLQADRAYRIVTTDFLFHGGDGYAFHEHAKNAVMTKINWRIPVVMRTLKAASSRKRPLESIIAAQAPAP